MSEIGDLAVAAAELPAFQGDPADRLIVATAIAQDAWLVMGDDAILEWRKGLRVPGARLATRAGRAECLVRRPL